MARRGWAPVSTDPQVAAEPVDGNAVFPRHSKRNVKAHSVTRASLDIRGCLIHMCRKTLFAVQAKCVCSPGRSWTGGAETSDRRRSCADGATGSEESVDGQEGGDDEIEEAEGGSSTQSTVRERAGERGEGSGRGKPKRELIHSAADYAARNGNPLPVSVRDDRILAERIAFALRHASHGSISLSNGLAALSGPAPTFSNRMHPS
jgi:hypothetical protein